MSVLEARKAKNRRSVCVEICHSQLHFIICDWIDDRIAKVDFDSVTWRREASNLNTDMGVAELTAAIKSVTSRYRVQGSEIEAALSGDFCVTRVVTGPADKVQSELSQLEHRSSSYLSLGHGPKTLAGSIRPIDAKQQHALMTIVNRRTVASLMEVSSRAGVQINWIEPSLVSLCRLLPLIDEAHADEPTLIVHINERGAEVGIAHRGNLLLDYRPSGRATPTEFADTLMNHLNRLQRYCNRYVSFAKGSLNRIYLSGEADQVASLHEQLKKRDVLEVVTLDPPTLLSNWKFSIEHPGVLSAACLGAAYRSRLDDDDQVGPNLLERMKAAIRQPMFKALCKTMWPIAATIALSLTAHLLAVRERANSSGLKTQITKYESEQREANLLRAQIIKHQTNSLFVTRILVGLNRSNWDDLTKRLAQCMPEDVWLDSLQMDRERGMQIDGAAYTEDGVFEFVRWLRKLPQVDRVSISATRLTRLSSGPATQFSVQCRLADSIDEKGEINDKS